MLDEVKFILTNLHVTMAFKSSKSSAFSCCVVVEPTVEKVYPGSHDSCPAVPIGSGDLGGGCTIWTIASRSRAIV